MRRGLAAPIGPQLTVAIPATRPHERQARSGTPVGICCQVKPRICFRGHGSASGLQEDRVDDVSADAEREVDLRGNTAGRPAGRPWSVLTGFANLAARS